MEKSGSGGSFPVGRLDTSLRTQGVRQGRRTFFLTLWQVVPAAIEELRSLPETEHEGEIINTAEDDLPQFREGRWLDLRPIALSRDVAASLQQQDPETQEQGLERRIDIEFYARFADHLFVPDSVVQWADTWNIGVEWCQAFATLIRSRWRNIPEQPLQEILETLHGFPVLHPLSEIVPLRLPLTRLGGYPAMASADPRTESEKLYVERAKAHYRDCLAFFTSLTRQGTRVDLDGAAEWLVRWQVRGETRADIAASADRTRQAINEAIQHLAALIEIKLRPANRGRRLGSKDSSSMRRRVTRSRTP